MKILTVLFALIALPLLMTSPAKADAANPSSPYGINGQKPPITHICPGGIACNRVVPTICPGSPTCSRVVPPPPPVVISAPPTSSVLPNLALPPGGPVVAGTNLPGGGAGANIEAALNAIAPGGPSSDPGFKAVRVKNGDLIGVLKTNQPGGLKARYVGKKSIHIRQTGKATGGADVVVVEIAKDQDTVLQQNASGQLMDQAELTPAEIAVLAEEDSPALAKM